MSPPAYGYFRARSTMVVGAAAGSFVEFLTFRHLLPASISARLAKSGSPGAAEPRRANSWREHLMLRKGLLTRWYPRDEPPITLDCTATRPPTDNSTSLGARARYAQARRWRAAPWADDTQRPFRSRLL